MRTGASAGSAVSPAAARGVSRAGGLTGLLSIAGEGWAVWAGVATASLSGLFVSPGLAATVSFATTGAIASAAAGGVGSAGASGTSGAGTSESADGSAGSAAGAGSLPSKAPILATQPSDSGPCSFSQAARASSATVLMPTIQSSAPSRISTAAGSRPTRPSPAATSTSSISWATCTSGARSTTRAAPLIECAARINGSIRSRVAPSRSRFNSPSVSTALCAPISSRNSSSRKASGTLTTAPRPAASPAGPRQ